MGHFSFIGNELVSVKAILQDANNDIYIDGYVQAMVDMAVAELEYNAYTKIDLRRTVQIIQHWHDVNYEIWCMMALIAGVE